MMELELSESEIIYTAISSSQINVDLVKPNGYFDTLDFTLTFLSTSSSEYFVDKTLPRPNCQNGTTIEKFNLTQDDIEKPLEITGLCPLSFYNGTVKTNRKDFESVQAIGSTRTSKF